MTSAYDDVLLAVAGAHLSGQPLNFQLTERGAELVESTTTAGTYRLFALQTTPPKPGVVRVADGGAALTVEVWRMTAAAFGDFVAGLPQPMAIGRVELADGRQCSGFLVEPIALDGAEDITAHGGWRQFLARPAGPQGTAGDDRPESVESRAGSPRHVRDFWLMSAVFAALAVVFSAIWLWQAPRQDFWPLWTTIGLAVGPLVAGTNALIARRRTRTDTHHQP